MKYPGHIVYEAIYGLLDGNAMSIPVYSAPQAGTEYIYLEQYVSEEASTKSEFMSRGYAQLQIVCKLNTGPSSKSRVLNATNMILGLLKPTVDSSLDLSPDFSNTSLWVESVLEDNSMTETERVFRIIVRLRMIVEQVI